MGSVYGVDAHPLYWPEDWTRTRPLARSSSRYKVSFVQARDHVLKNVKLMGGRDPVISSNIPLRRDGLPLANIREPDDVGVAVYWTERIAGKDVYRVLACDCWQTTRDNLHAIGLSLEALRSIKRAGATQIVDRAFMGFTALPASTGRAWWVVLGVSQHAFRNVIEQAYRELAYQRHPDRGGTHEQMVELNAAYKEATGRKSP